MDNGKLTNKHLTDVSKLSADEMDVKIEKEYHDMKKSEGINKAVELIENVI